VLHSFAGDLQDARWAVARGFVLGIGGPVTYKNSRLPAILAELSPDDVVLETDAPWLPPMPHRGHRNEPAFLLRTAEAVAAVFGMPLAMLAEIVAANVARIFPRAEAA
jgi:TatD DNase family protein